MTLTKMFTLWTLAAVLGYVALTTATKAEDMHCEGPFVVVGITITGDNDRALLRFKSVTDVKIIERPYSEDTAKWFNDHKRSGEEVFICDDEILTPPQVPNYTE